MDSIINWDEIPWEENPGQPGYRSKTAEREGQAVWLAESSEGFDEGGWRRDGHLFHVLAGESSLRFKDGRVIRLHTGESGILVAGEAVAHRVEVAAGEPVVIVAFDQPWPTSDTR